MTDGNHNMPPGQPADNEPRDVLDFIDETVARITDADIEKNLRETLRRAGYGLTAQDAERFMSAHPQRVSPETSIRPEAGDESVATAHQETVRVAEVDREGTGRAQEQAAAILRNARDQAKQIIAKANDEAEQIVTDVRNRRAYQAGSGSARGILYVHSAPPALCPHIQWAVSGILGASVSMRWVAQPAEPGSLFAELTWSGRPGTAGAMVSALAGWNRLRFEVAEDSSPGCDGVRYCYTPDLGIFTAVTSANGDILVPENRLRAALTISATGASVLDAGLERLLGTAWDNELEPFRRAAETAPGRFPGVDVAG